MKISSSAFKNGEKIPSEFTCDGENASPPLAIADVPEGAVSLVLIMDDVDAPAGVFDHRVVFDLPVVAEIKSGQEPGVGGRNSFGKTGYGGPCPHQGEHRYYFRLFALDTKLGLPAGSAREAVEKAMGDHVLERADLAGKYAR